MKVTINEKDDLDEKLQKLNEIIKAIEKINDTSFGLVTMSTQDLAEAFKCSITTARDIFNIPGFPCCDYAKEKRAEINAVREFFSVRRCKNDQKN